MLNYRIHATSLLHVRDELWKTTPQTFLQQHDTFIFFCQLFHILALLLMPEFWATYGPQTPTDMWSVPQDVTIVTAPPKAGGAGGASLLVRWWEGWDTISLINILYGPPGLWRWPAQPHKWSQSSWFVPSHCFTTELLHPFILLQMCLFSWHN